MAFSPNVYRKCPLCQNDFLCTGGRQFFCKDKACRLTFKLFDWWIKCDSRDPRIIKNRGIKIHFSNKHCGDRYLVHPGKKIVADKLKEVRAKLYLMDKINEFSHYNTSQITTVLSSNFCKPFPLIFKQISYEKQHRIFKSSRSNVRIDDVVQETKRN